MSDIVISVENLSKQYRLGAIGGRTLRADLSRWWAKRRGQPDPYLRIGQEDLRERYGETIWALRDINLQVRQGEILGIIGRNGAGKSTLLKILSRITAPTSGEVKVKGRIGSLLEVGTGFHPELTGRENVFLNGAILGMTKAEVARKFDEIVDFAGIEQFIDTPVKRYSSGMYVRLAFAVAAHLEPEILIVDEVLAVGDDAFRKKSSNKMSDSAKQGRTVIFVSHNMAAIRNLCPTTILLDRGRVIGYGETNDVVDSYIIDRQTGMTSVFQPLDRPEAPGIVTHLTLRDNNGNERSQFAVGERWSASLRINLRDSIRHFRAALGITSVESVPLVTYWSIPQDLAPGQYVADFSCNLPFSPGGLQFTVGLSSFENTFFYQQDVGQAWITECATEVRPLRASGTGVLTGFQRVEVVPLCETTEYPDEEYVCS